MGSTDRMDENTFRSYMDEQHEQARARLKDWRPAEHSNLAEWFIADPQTASEAVRAAHIEAGASEELAEVAAHIGRMVAGVNSPARQQG